MPPVVHLGATTTRPAPVLVRLSLGELTVLGDRAGVRLPVDLHPDDDQPEGRLEERLGGETPSTVARARSRVHEALAQAREHPAVAVDRLRALDLLDETGAPVGAVVAALRVLGAPEALMVLDLAVAGDGAEPRLRAWFAVVGTDVVQLSTVSGLLFELAWYDVSRLPGALARAATVDEGSDPEPVDLGAPLQLPFELFTDGTEAVRRGRDDLLAELVRIAPAPVRVAGAEVSPGTAADVVATLEHATRGRLRVLVTVPQEDDVRRTVGLVSWLRVGGRWRSLTPSRVDGVPTLTLEVVEPRQLATAVAPVLAELLG